jgi:hypothetical protein
LKPRTSNELFLTFGDVTAPFFSWLVPTLPRGICKAAYEPPPSATNKASNATSIDGDGLRKRMKTKPPRLECENQAAAKTTCPLPKVEFGV